MKDKLKIAVCYNNPIGGSGQAIYEMTKGLMEYHEVQLFTPGPEGRGIQELETLKPLRPFVYRDFPPIPRPFGRLYSLTSLVELNLIGRVYRKLAKEINQGFDVAVVYPCLFTPSPLILRYLTIPSVLFTDIPMRREVDLFQPRPYKGGRALGKYSLLIDRWDPLQRLREYIYARVDRENAQHASLMLVYSCYSREMHIYAYKVNPVVHYLGIDTDTFRPLSVEKEDVILSIGHVRPRKAHDFVVEALGLVPGSRRPALVIAGDASDAREREYLLELGRKLGVEIKFEHTSKREEIVLRYNRAKIVAYAPILEPFGLVPLEAMACEVPVVGVREAGIRETIMDGEGGYLTDRDPEKFAERLDYLLTHYDTRIEQGQKGRDYVLKNWTRERSTKKLIERIERLVENSGNGAARS